MLSWPTAAFWWRPLHYPSLTNQADKQGIRYTQVSQTFSSSSSARLTVKFEIMTFHSPQIVVAKCVMLIMLVREACTRLSWH